MSTNFLGGVTQATESSTLGVYPVPDPTALHQWFDDFDDYTAGEWTITETGTGTRAVGNLNNGVLVITNAAADDDANFLQWSGNTAAGTVENWKFVSGKKSWFVARFKVSDATQSDVVMGLQITDTTPLAVTDGLYFLKADGSTTLNLLATLNSTSTTTAVATMANDTYVKVGYFYDGGSNIFAYLNDVRVGTSVTTNLVTDEELTISFGIQNGEAVAKIMSVDYIMVGFER